MTYGLTIKYVTELLKQQGVELEVLIVDNKSPNDSFMILIENFKEIKNVEVIQSNHNGGYAYGNNYGLHFIEKRNYDYVAISNNDVFFSDMELLAKMAIKYESLVSPALASPIQLMNGSPASCAWKLPSIWFDIFTNLPLIGKWVTKRNQYVIPEDKDYLKVDVLPGSFFMFKHGLMEEVDYFDENTFLYCEERILACKVKNMGLQNYLLTNLTYNHEHSATISSNIKKVKMLKIAHESIAYYHKKYLKTSSPLLVCLSIIHLLVRMRVK